MVKSTSAIFFIMADCAVSVVMLFCSLKDDPEDFAEEQSLMGRFINLFHADNLDQQYLVGLISRRNEVL